MLTLAVLLQIVGLILTFTLGVPGYVIGPLAVIAGGLLFRHEIRRRKEFAANPATVAAAAGPPRRPGWQRFLIGFAAAIVFFAGIFTLAWRITGALAATADGFFLAMNAGDMETARGFLAEDFRAATSEAELRTFVEKSALANYESATWTHRSIDNASGFLAGTENTRSGGAVPLEISLVREGGAWKILSLRKPEAGLLDQKDGQGPSPAEQLRLTRDTTRRLADAITRRDFRDFHADVATLWRKQVTVEELAQGFRSFTDQQVDLRVLNDLEARVETAGFDDQGAFAIAGRYPTTPSTLTFRYRYLYEGVDWKLVGVNLQAQ